MNLGAETQGGLISSLAEEFNVVYPTVNYKNGKILKNFDVGFVFDDKELKDTFEEYDIPHIGCKRVSKSIQKNRLVKLGINSPNTFKPVFRGSYDSYNTLLSNYEDDDIFVVKPEFGARGIGQLLISKNNLHTFFDDCYCEEMSDEDLVSKYSISGASGFNNYIRGSVKGSDFLLQEKMDIKKEWRCIYLYGQDPIIIKRTVGVSWQANSCITGLASIVRDKDSLEIKVIKEISDKLGNSLNTPFLSIDVYQEKNGTIGIIEYQMEMGYSFVPKTELHNKIIKSVKNLLKDKGYEKD